MRRLGALLVLLSAGCVPDLGDWRVVIDVSGDDAGGPIPDGGRDASAPIDSPNPIDLGPPCPRPHLVLSTTTNTSSSARVLRVDPSTGARCRNAELVESQRAFGSTIHDVAWHAETGELLGLPRAVLALDDEGFPRWRAESTDFDGFAAQALAVLGTGANLRVVLAWNRSSSTIDRLQLLDRSGIPTSGMITLPVFASMIAVHPDGTLRLLLPSRSGDNIEVYPVRDTDMRIDESTMTQLWPADVDLDSAYGSRVHLASDLTTRRLVITHERGIALWQVGDPPPSSAIGCPSECTSLSAAAPDPSAHDAAYALCAAAAGSTRHLVHVRPGSCTRVIDGTSLGSHTLTGIALARAPL